MRYTDRLWLDVETQDVRDFHRKFNVPSRKLGTGPGHVSLRTLRQRGDHLREELDEFVRAALIQDLAGMADALVDLVYVAKGTAIMLGLPWERLWNEVQTANMAKEPRRTKRHDHDVVKPDGWQPPDIAGTLQTAGYDRREWFDHNVFINERCNDDQT